MLQEEEYGMNEGPPQKKPLIDLYEDQLQKTNYEEDDDAMQIDNDDEIHLSNVNFTLFIINYLLFISFI